jgi:hypothetical protein
MVFKSIQKLGLSAKLLKGGKKQKCLFLPVP